MKRGDQLGAFQLVQTIGVGAQGRVWRALHVETGAEAAVKVVERHFAGRTHAWTAELNALARLDHPNIARVHDYGLLEARTDEHLDGAAWIAMEFCTWPFAKLSDDLDSWSSVQAVLSTLATGLAHAHARGVLHRDLKPGNLLVGGRTPSIDSLKIVDFGIAILDGATLRRARGTPAYMAPEQFIAEPSRLGPWTDLYSLGILGWLLVTGLRPFPRREPAALLESKRALDLEPFLPRFDVPDSLEGFLRRALHPDIGSRYLCAADFLSDLHGLGTATMPGTAGPAPDQTLLPTVPASAAPETSSPQVEPLAAVPPTPRPAGFSDEVLRPWPDGGALAALRDVPLVGRHRAREALWSTLEPGARIRLEGPGARELARWAIRRLREQTGHLALGVEGHPDDLPGAALLRLLDEALGFSGSADRVRAAREALGRYRARFGAAETAIPVLLGYRAPTSVLRHGAAAAVLDALARQRGLVVFVAGLPDDRDLATLLRRLDRALPDVALVEVTEAEGDAVLGEAAAIEVGMPALDEAVDALCTLLDMDRTDAVHRLQACELDVSQALRPSGFDPLGQLLPSEISAVEYAAVLGTVDRSVWGDVVTLTTGGLLGLEDELVRRGVARRRPGGWVFRDPDLRARLVERLEDSGRLQSAAAAAADALDARNADPLRRGRLWTRAGRTERAIEVWLEGADRIEDTHGRRASVELWGYARVLALELEPSEAIQGELDTRHVAGMVMLLDRRPEAGELAGVHRLRFEELEWNRSAALCCWVQSVASGVTRPELALRYIDEGLALTEGHPEARDIEGRLWGNRFRISHENATGEHLTDLQRSRDALEGLPDARSRLLHHRMAGLHAQMTGDLDTAVEHFAVQVEIARNERPNAMPESIVQHAVALTMAGRPGFAPEAERLLGEALDLATFAESAHQAAYAALNGMTLALKREGFVRAAELASRALDFASHSPHAALACHLGLAVCAVGLHDDRAPEAWALARQGLRREHVAEGDFVDMLDQIAGLATGALAHEAAELARAERAALSQAGA